MQDCVFPRSSLAYGDNGSPPKIPGGATLNFEVELLSFEGGDITKETSKGVIKRTLEAGEGLDHPNEESQVEVAIRCEHRGQVVDERELAFSLGEGAEHGVPKGVELALEKMKRAEKARITVLPEYAFGSEGDVARGIPPEATLDYEVTVK